MLFWPWRSSKFKVDDYVIEVGHLSKFAHEHKVTDTQGRVVYETDYLCIFRVKFAESWTVYFRHLEIQLETHTNTADIMLVLLLLVATWVVWRAQQRQDFDFAEMLQDDSHKASALRLGVLGSFAISSWI